MSVHVAGKAVVLLLCFPLFLTCGELDTLFPSNGSYQIKTLVNGNSLENCSIIRSNDKIRPYFAVSVGNDPDLIGLLVYLQDFQGEIIGERVQYILQAYAGESALTEFEAIEAMKEKEKKQPNNPPSGKTITAKETEASENDNESKTDGQAAGELPKYGTVVEKTPNEKLEIAVKSLAHELPYFFLSKNLEIGPYILVFEALGQREILSRTESNIFYLGDAEFNLKDISMYLPGPFGSQLISPGTTVMLEAGLDFDSRLDPYVIWYNGKNIINEGKISDAAGNILWQAPEQAGFYSLRLEAFPSYLKRNNFTGFFREIALPVSPKAVSLGYFFENNPEYTARSPLSAGTAYPEQIQLLKARFSKEPGTTETVENSAPVSPSPPELFQWYQFEGSLHNSMPASTNRQTLLPGNKSPIRWAAAGQSYGLAIGPDDPYVLSPINFFREEKDQGGGIFLLHIKPPTEGVIFSVLFPLRSSSTNGVWMDMIKEKNVIALRLRAKGTTVEIPVYSAASREEGLIPIVVEFFIKPYRLEAKISLDKFLQSKVGSIQLPGVLSGESRLILGGRLENSRLESSILENSLATLAASEPKLTEYQSEEIPFEGTTETDSAERKYTLAAVETSSPDAIWDELAILFSTVPLLPKEFFEEVITEQNAAGKIISAKPEPAAIGNITSLVDIDTDNPIKERETQERKTPFVLSENS